LNNLLKDIKENHTELKGVYSLLLENVAFRVRKALLSTSEDRRYENINYYDWAKKWFTLQYPKCNYGYKVENRRLRISLSSNHKINATLLENKRKFEPVYLEITKQHNRYFAIFCQRTEVPEPIPLGKIRNWIAIDQNHENFFVAINSNGQSIRINKLQSESYFNQSIDDIVDKIKICNNDKRKAELYRVLNRTTNKRKEQTDTALHKIAKELALRYDLVLIGDYVPCREDIPFENMKKVMVDRTHIVYFRKILEWNMKKNGKIFKLVDERLTTQRCCICGFEEYRDPHQRSFKCKKTGELVIRDLNACINIARKGGVIVNNPIVNQIMFTYRFDYKKGRLVLI
jgi:putative transposase